MAGRGKRFTDEDYALPKPFIEVNGTPMFVTATKSLPTADKNIFLALREHRRKYHLARTLKDYFKKSAIITVNQVTEGQASTCMLAESQIDSDAQLTIGACDNGMTYERKKFDQLMNEKDTDAIIWTFRHYPGVLVNPSHWGWVSVNKKGLVKKVSVKVPISDDPINDYVVVGCFSFKKARYFFENCRKMITDDRRINNEFYNDECINVLIENGLTVKVFEIDKYLGWGTPNDLKTYQYWQEYFAKRNGKS